jgi:hypothetical protein
MALIEIECENMDWIKMTQGMLQKSRGSSGSIVSDYGLDDRGSISGRGRGFFF